MANKEPQGLELSPRDVICGRSGNPRSKHPGNALYRKVISRKRDEYSAAAKGRKKEIAIEIVSKIYGESKGRFLVFDRDIDGWVDIGEEKACLKTSQALREAVGTAQRGKRRRFCDCVGECTKDNHRRSSTIKRRHTEAGIKNMVEMQLQSFWSRRDSLTEEEREQGDSSMISTGGEGLDPTLNITDQDLTPSTLNVSGSLGMGAVGDQPGDVGSEDIDINPESSTSPDVLERRLQNEAPRPPYWWPDPDALLASDDSPQVPLPTNSFPRSERMQGRHSTSSDPRFFMDEATWRKWISGCPIVIGFGDGLYRYQR